MLGIGAACLTMDRHAIRHSMAGTTMKVTLTSLVAGLIFLTVHAHSGEIPSGGITVTGPITGGKQGRPFSAPQIDLNDYGYSTTEYFIEGTATAYEFAKGRKKTADGLWTVYSKDEKVPYRTRILVVRPDHQDDFNGTVVLHWQNVTAGYEVGSAGGEYLRGYAWVGVSAQKVGVDGSPGPRPAGLRQWDPDRYGNLVHPGDPYCYDIFTQAATVVAPDRKTRGNDPMAGLQVERLIASGASQSASRLRTYINAVHPIARIFDGFMPYIDFSSTSGLATRIPRDRSRSVQTATRIPRNRSRYVPASARIREDLDVPVFVINSETEILPYLGARQPDTDKFRLWEVAGSSHVSIPRVLPDSEAASAIKAMGLESPNWHSYAPAYNAALRHMHIWLKNGTPPPAFTRVRIAQDKEARIQRDRYGNAVGGIRLPDFAVPTAEHRGIGIRKPGGTRFGPLYGYARDFTSEELKALYPDERAFKAAYEAAIAASIRDGVILKEDAAAMRERTYLWVEKMWNKERREDDGT